MEQTQGFVDPTEGFHQSHSGLWVPEREKRPTGVDLFCGCGGFSCGFIQAGYEVVAAVDFEPEAMITYAVNLGSHPIKMHFVEPADKDRMEKRLEREMGFHKKDQTITRSIISGQGWISGHPEYAPVRNVWIGDVRKLKGRDILNVLGMKRGEIDCVFGGPPCQGFSTTGKQDVMDPRNSLVFEFARLILELWPKTMVMENVPGIINMVTPGGIPVVDEFCRILEDGGFGVMNALKRSLLQTAGAGAALRSKPHGKGTKKEQVNEDDDQLNLFED